ncbi:MAG: hypothetical protein FWD19_00750, partial [Defluviitaleaceae bacterium]|nr:hypothetical protein [Defluviitaleaceae bacterium]
NMFAIIEGTAGSLNAAMNSGVDVALTEMQTVLDTLVGQIGMATPTTIANPDYVPASGGWEGPSGNHATQPTLANGDPNPAYTNTGDPFAAAVGTPTIPNPVATIPNPEHAQWLADNPTLDPADNPHAATIPNPDYVSGLAAAPLNTLLDHMEKLLDMSTDVLGNVNLESNAMWFQIGPNSLQGMVLQLKGIHTGILGGGRGDLAMLIDVRERSGIPISEQLEFIDLAEGIVNSQRAQLGAVQNRLEFTRQSLDISSENLSAAESRIRDTDMAKEMMRFTAAQVLQQAGISMLAQANQLPASILQLLQ